MTPTTPQACPVGKATSPLYSDRYINELIDRRIKSYGGNAKVGARRVAYTMRDDYEVTIDSLRQQLAALTAQLQAAQEWQPVSIEDKSNLISRAQYRGIVEQGFALCRKVKEGTDA